MTTSKKTKPARPAPKTKTKIAAKAKARPTKPKLVAKAKPALEKNGFMWRLLERKQAALEARKPARPETPYENRYTRLAPPGKKTG